MLTILAEFGNNEDERGEKCLRWAGLPAVYEIKEAIIGPDVSGMRIEVLLALPLERINVYGKSDMHGSYDGEVLSVSCKPWRARGQLTEAISTVAETYQALRDFYMDIVHGRVAGQHPATGMG